MQKIYQARSLLLYVQLFVVIVFVIIAVACTEKREVQSNGVLENQNEVFSPNGKIAFRLQLTTYGEPRYTVARNNVEVLLESKLGLDFDAQSFSRELALTSVSDVSLYEDKYSMGHGKQKNIHYRANEKTFVFENTNKFQMILWVRVSDDGLAFKYDFKNPESTESNQQYSFVSEATSFNFPVSTRAWLQPVAQAQTGWSNTNPSYEEHYRLDIPVGVKSPMGAAWAFPSLFKVQEDNWVLLTEAGMRGDFHASRLEAIEKSGEYKLGQPMAAEVKSNGALLARGQFPLSTPWRIIAIGDLASIVESTLGTDLADPAIATSETFTAGLSAWSWALLKDESVNYDTTKEFIDYAAEMQWPYVLVDASWDTRIGYERVKELSEYAATKNVALLLWYNSSGDWNITEYTPKSALIERDQRRAEFAKLQAIGIKGVKIDFFSGDGVSMMEYYNDLAADAAEFGLTVNYHGASLPRGLHRTYPNLMTMESVHGFEMITFNQSSADKAAEFMTMLPYTRNVYDPMDFTPTTFFEIPNIERRTTNGFELALPVLFLSGIQHIAETAENMKKVEPFVRDYMKEVPVDWDESMFVAGEPGKLAVIARRKGERWYVAGINGENVEKTIDLDLSFLEGRNGKVISDNSNPRELHEYSIIASGEVSMAMLGNGGFVMMFDESNTAP